MNRGGIAACHAEFVDTRSACGALS